MDYRKLDDVTLIRLVVNRQQDALSELYDRFGCLVYSIGLNAIGQAELYVKSAQPLAIFESFGVTIEPEGGSPAPTGEKMIGGGG